jgi:GLPGLI family protein
MKYFLVLTFIVSLSKICYTQQKEGRVIYEKTYQILAKNASVQKDVTYIDIKAEPEQFEMNFASNRMNWRQLPTIVNNSAFDITNPGEFTNVSTGFNDGENLFCDLTKQILVQQMSLYDKKYIVTDSLKKGRWKITEDTRIILGHNCRKAISQIVEKKVSYFVLNGKLEPREVIDSSIVTAWYAIDIPVSFGPEMQGQLPGLILRLEIRNGDIVYSAVKISSNANRQLIKEPIKGKKVTKNQFEMESEKLNKQMIQNHKNISTFPIKPGN